MPKNDYKPFNGKLPRGLGKYRGRISDFNVNATEMWIDLLPGWKTKNNEHTALINLDKGEDVTDLIELVKNAEACTCDKCEDLKLKAPIKKRGGRRPGAGRKKGHPNTKKVVKSVALTKDTITKLDILAKNAGLSSSAYLEDLIINLHKQSI